MASHAGEGQTQVAFAGRELERRLVLAFTLPSLVALLALGVVAHRYAVASAHPGGRSGSIVVFGLLVCTAVATVPGGYIVRDVGRTVATLGRLLGGQGDSGGLEQRRDAVGTVVASVNAVLAIIEQQAADISSCASRLDAAHQELESTRAQLKEFSFRDDVTGLYNRRFFGLRLEEEIARYRRFNHPVSVVMMDLDGFKAVNDTLGHAVGDETLREVAQLVLKHSRGINVVCRYGGDEYAVLLVETSKAGARMYGDRIRQVIANYSFSHGRAITASLGVANLPEDEAATSEDLVRAADAALYVAKRAGRNQVAMATSSENPT
jgi:diguanylate cyclase (GGDEF)-like protein